MKFVDLCKQLGVQFRETGHEHCRKGWVQIECPQCVHQSGPGHFRLGYNLRGGYANCWLCGPIYIGYALSALSGQNIDSRLLKDLERDVKWKEKLKPRGTYLPPAGTGLITEAHDKYLRGRKFDPNELTTLWDIEYLGHLGGKYKWRILIPIYYQGRPVSWTTRSVRDDVKLRYVSAPPERELIDHKSLLYGEDYVRHAIIICEGPTDVWRVGPGAVCTFGTGWKTPQVARMVKYPVRVVCFDSEEAAQARAKALCDRLEVFDGETYNVVLKAKDPGDATREEIKELRRRFLDE